MINKYTELLINIITFSSLMIISPIGILIYWLLNDKSIFDSIIEFYKYSFVFIFQL